MTAHRLRFHPQFVTGLEAAITYYDGESKIIGAKFKAAAKRQLGLVKKNPYSKSVRYDDVRFARIVKFPYAIHYSIDVTNNIVLVHRILCDYQDPATNWGKKF